MNIIFLPFYLWIKHNQFNFVNSIQEKKYSPSGKTPAEPDSPHPSREMNEKDFLEVKTFFSQAAKRAKEAGYDIIIIHMAHGLYLYLYLFIYSTFSLSIFAVSIPQPIIQ